MWHTIEVMVERSDLSNLGDRGSAEKVSNLLGVQDPWGYEFCGSPARVVQSR